MNNKYSILVLDDDPYTLEIFELLENVIEKCQIFTSISFNKVKEIIRDNKIDLIMLDVVMPEVDGYEVFKILKTHPNTEDAYFIFMSADKNQLLDRLKGYSLGAHDFISKPFDIKELEFIIKNKINYFQRTEKPVDEKEKVLIKGKFVLNSQVKKVIVAQKEISLTKLEFKLMYFLLSNPVKALTNDDIGAGVWGDKSLTTTDNVRTLIYKLRAKIESNPQEPMFLINSKSNGYIFYPSGHS